MGANNPPSQDGDIFKEISISQMTMKIGIHHEFGLNLIDFLK